MIDLHGQKFIVLKEEVYRSWHETDYLLSSTKNTTAALENALKEPLEECSDLSNNNQPVPNFTNFTIDQKHRKASKLWMAQIKS